MSVSSRLLFSVRPLAAATTLALLLAGCASNPTTTGSISAPDMSMSSADQRMDALTRLASQYKQAPNDRTTVLYYSAALRANGQNEQAAAVLEAAMGRLRNDPEIRLAYAKALAGAGRFEQALNIVESAIDPTSPDWNALMVKGAILDQSGQSPAARQLYQQALQIAPNQPSLHANLGLSYAMTNELDKAESELRLAVKLPGAGTKVRQNLALIVGLQGRFDESRQIFAADLPPEQVEANMSYIRALLTQQNRWDLIKGAG